MRLLIVKAMQDIISVRMGRVMLQGLDIIHLIMTIAGLNVLVGIMARRQLTQ